jgi:hypothetical protein
MASEITPVRNTQPTALKAGPKAAAADKTAVMSKDRLVVKNKPEAAKAPTAPKPAANVVATAPGEETRNKLSIFGMISAPFVQVFQGITTLAKATVANPLLHSIIKGPVKAAQFLNNMPFLKNPLLLGGVKLLGRCLPFLSAAILAFDGYATVHTLRNKEASGERKLWTSLRFAANAVGTGLSFIPGWGMIAAIPAGLIGNVFEFKVMKLNKEEAQAAKK